MFKGKIKVFDKDGNLTKEYPNAFVLSGRYFALEALLPVLRSTNSWIDDLTTTNVRYFEPGSSTVVNGNDGPVELGGSVAASDWVNGSMYDYDIGTSIHKTAETSVRLPVSVLRRDGRTITIEFELNNTYTTSTTVNEVGIYFGNGGDLTATRYPQYAPDDGAWTVNDRKHGLLARILFVKYNEATDEWDADPIDCTSAQTIQYELRMI